MFVVGLTALALVGFGLQACGPSVQFIYEGNIRFEHCYRLDFDENIAPTHRKVCWEDWLARYTRGQTRDRLEYATRRIGAIVAGDRGTLTLHMDRPHESGVSGSNRIPAPVPTSLHAPPPARMVAPPAVSGTASSPVRREPNR